MDKLSPEEKLLRAIFGDKKPEVILCAKCGEEVANPIYYNGEPYHPKHLPRDKK